MGKIRSFILQGFSLYKIRIQTAHEHHPHTNEIIPIIKNVTERQNTIKKKLVYSLLSQLVPDAVDYRANHDALLHNNGDQQKSKLWPL